MLPLQHLAPALLLTACTPAFRPDDPAEVGRDPSFAHESDPRYEVLSHAIMVDEPIVRHMDGIDPERLRAQLPFERLSISRSGCYGTCPAFRVDLYRDGRMVYEGRLHVDPTGIREDQFALSKYARLCSTLETIDALQMEDDYRANWSDDTTTTYEFEHAGGIKTIKDYGRVGPAALEAYRAQFERYLMQYDWFETELTH